MRSSFLRIKDYLNNPYSLTCPFICPLILYPLLTILSLIMSDRTWVKEKIIYRVSVSSNLLLPKMEHPQVLIPSIKVIPFVKFHFKRQIFQKGVHSFMEVVMAHGFIRRYCTYWNDLSFCKTFSIVWKRKSSNYSK